MNHLGPLHESDRLLDLLAARRPLSPDDRDPLALALAEWAREVDGPTRAGRAQKRCSGEVVVVRASAHQVTTWHWARVMPT